MRIGRLVAVAACLALTACGSTVELRGQALQGGGSLAPSTESGTTGSTVTGTAGGLAPSTTGSVAGGTGATTQVPTVTSQPPVVKSAATKSPVEVGIVLFPDVSAFAAALGGSAEVGDQRGMADTAVKWINGHGGLAGHTVKPVYFEVELTSTQPYAVTYEEICTSFTQDHHVVAVIAIANVEAGLPSCLQKTRTLFLAHGHYLHSADDYRALANLVTPEEAGSDRVARALVSEVFDRGLVRSGDKLGLLVMNYAGPRKARDKIIVPAMKARGVSVVDYEIPYPQSTPEIANSASVVQSAQLAMAAQGIKNVAFMCPGCMSFFMQYAESQAYYPRYLLTSFDSVGALKAKSHGRSLQGSLGLGFEPVKDVGVYTNPGLLKGNATYELCRTIEKDFYSDDVTIFAALAFCGALQDLYAAARANPVNVTGVSLLGGFGALGTSSPGAGNFSTRLAADQRDGITSYRTMHYESGCECMAYDKAALKPLR
jgi:hypothetical protein